MLKGFSWLNMCSTSIESGVPVIPYIHKYNKENLTI